MRNRTTGLAAATVGLALLATGCGLESGGGGSVDVEAGSIPTFEELEGQTIAVGSKELTEQLILGQIAVQALTAAGADVQDETNIAGSENARRAILNGDIDLMWEYTGTAWLIYEGQEEVIKDPREQYEAIRDRDLEENDMVWLDPPAPMNNTYALVVTPETAKKYDLTGISDFLNIPEDERSLCVDTEYHDRSDGLAQTREDYEISTKDLPNADVQTMDSGVVYTSVAEGKCTVGSAYSTDGRIKALGLKMLEDDQNVFPIYNPAITVKKDFAEKYPMLEEIFGPIAEKLDTETVMELNAQADQEGDAPATVAKEWLTKEGFLKE
ncbi:glycine betaine ABC transporter substrate-binding protein [Nocardiopsis rhodophaea]|uniref:glycine betaine ABC transporter substrate-binding protein n=1 Tax=Nocardiopsis rhodophaea TaxID=280238 RepID=UPI0031DB4CA3